MKLSEILARCDHTLLGQTATWEDIKAICDDGIKYSTASVCIPAAYVREAKEYVGDRLQICTVIGFPNGYSTTATKVFECADAIKNGADEIDTVINVGVSGPGVVRAALAKAGDCDLTAVADLIKKTAFKITRMGQLVATEASRRLGVPFGIVASDDRFLDRN